MKIITLTGSYLMGFRKLERPVRLRQVYSLAGKYHWDIRVTGQHWEGPQDAVRPPALDKGTRVQRQGTRRPSTADLTRSGQS